MNLTRRGFLYAGGMVGLAALLQGSVSPLALGLGHKKRGIGTVIPQQALNNPLYLMTRAMFTENLKTKFAISLGGVKLGYMVLIGVNNLNPSYVRSDPTSSRECFSIVFQGPRGLNLRQETYTLDHGKMGKFQLLIVPQDRSSQHYEAIINRVYP